MAATIKASIAELNSIGDLPEARPLAPQLTESTPGLPAILTEEDILSPTKPKTIETPIDGLRAGGVPDFASRQSTDTYYAFTKAFDEIVEASDLAEQAEILKRHKYIETFSRALRKIHNRSLSSFLSRFKPREGAPPLSVSILIDNSGSMRGAKITHTVAWCNIMAEWMDRLRISTEFLGYTTRAWKGGRSKGGWIAAGRPANPGRLNDLRHLIYKSFSASLGAAAPNFGVMAIEGVLKENIDGEAILWAISRLQQQTSSSKILFVIGDGAPVDDTTLSFNPGNYLEKHLREVIDSTPANIKLYAIGLGHDVSRYYPNAVTVNEASELGPRFFEMLVNDEAFQRGFVSSDPKKRYRYYISDEKE